MSMQHKIYQNYRLSKGFTLVELLVIAPVVILVIGGFVGAIIAMTGNVLSTRSANRLVYNIQDALDRIEADVRQSNGFLSTNADTPQIGQGKESEANKFNAPADGLIISFYATDKNPINDDHAIYLDSDSNTLSMEIVYFVEGGTLWRRIIAPDGYPVGGTQWQQPSCKAIDASNIYCKAKDVRLVDGVGSDGFAIDYLNALNVKIDNPGETEIASCKTIKITITAKGGAAGREYSESGTIRATRPE